MTDGLAGYRPVRRLGRGGMGVVDLATDPEDREVALKRLSLHGTPEEISRARGRIRREADVLAALDHPALVGLLDVVDDGDDLVLVMPYLAGGTLAQRVGAHGPMRADEVMTVAARLLDGLTHAHRAGVVHRDIKPPNILFDENGDAYLADFGAASTRDATLGLTGSELVIGTPGFMAPEQARGEEVTTAVDVFSLGATLLYAATGSGPYGAGESRVLMYKAAGDKVERLPPGLPPELAKLLGPMLDPRPERRPSAASLRPAGPGGTWPHTRFAVARTRTRTRRRLIVAGALAALALVGGLGYALTGGGAGPAKRSSGPATSTIAAPACTPLPYQPCGQRTPAPFTNATDCIDGHADYDHDPANGCEAAPDHAPGTTFTDGTVIHANLVPANNVDTYKMPVADHRQLSCDGTLKVTLTAPKGATMRLEVLDPEGKALGSVISADGTAGTVTTRERHCMSSDAGVYEARVSWLGAERTASNYTLIRSGSF